MLWIVGLQFPHLKLPLISQFCLFFSQSRLPYTAVMIIVRIEKMPTLRVFATLSLFALGAFSR